MTGRCILERVPCKFSTFIPSTPFFKPIVDGGGAGGALNWPPYSSTWHCGCVLSWPAKPASPVELLVISYWIRLHTMSMVDTVILDPGDLEYSCPLKAQSRTINKHSGVWWVGLIRSLLQVQSTPKHNHITSTSPVSVWSIIGKKKSTPAPVWRVCVCYKTQPAQPYMQIPPADPHWWKLQSFQDWCHKDAIWPDFPW